MTSVIVYWWTSVIINAETSVTTTRYVVTLR